MTSRISKKEAEYMLLSLELTPELRAKLEAVLQGQAELIDDEAIELRELAGDRLQTHGFGPNYEPTEEGKYLEYLIDRLFTG